MAGWDATREAREVKTDALHEQLTGAVEQLVMRRTLESAAHFRSRSHDNDADTLQRPPA